MSIRWRAGALAAVLVASTIGCGGDGGPRQLEGLVRTPPLDVSAVTLPDVTVTEPGTPFRFVAPPGGLLVVYFGFTNCPDLCPTTLADLRAARRRIGPPADAVELVLVTVDPRRDTADVLRRYAGSFADRFHVVRTTDDAELQRALTAFLASSTIATDGPTYEVAHTAGSYVIDDRGVVVVEWPFGIGAEGMENDLRILLETRTEIPS